MVLLTAQDYPIKPNRDIFRFFGFHIESNFIEYFRLPDPRWARQAGGLARFERWYSPRLGRLLGRRTGRLPLPRKRRFPLDLKPYGGSSYWCLNHAAVTYVACFVRDNPGFVRFFRHVLIPDEMFFQTILLNSPLAPSCVNDNLRYIDWTARSSHPATLGVDALPELASSAHLFARKFDLEESRTVLDRIDRELLGLDTSPERPNMTVRGG
jgi:hypothetical protein